MPTLSTRPSGPGEATRRTDGPHRGMCVLILDGHRLVSTALRTALRNTGLDAHELAVGDPDTIVAGAARYPAGVVLLGLALGTDARGRRIRPVELVTALARQGKPTLVFSENGNGLPTTRALRLTDSANNPELRRRRRNQRLARYERGVSHGR